MRLKIEVVAGALAGMWGCGFPAATPETLRGFLTTTATRNRTMVSKQRQLSRMYTLTNMPMISYGTSASNT